LTLDGESIVRIEVMPEGAPTAEITSGSKTS
jgi:hypothetical protein